MNLLITQNHFFSFSKILPKLKENLISLGYTKEEVVKMTKTFPILYSLSIENIKEKLEDVIALGYTKEEVIKMTKILPTIFGLSIENIEEKIEFYDSINMHELAYVAPNKLIQSTALSYARYMFYKENGLEITMENYKKLFLSNKQFAKQYGTSKKELLEKYDYEKYKENVNGRTV